MRRVSFKRGKGDYVPTCMHNWNIDLLDGCIAYLNPCSDHYDNQDPARQEEFYSKYGACVYCYARHKNAVKLHPLRLDFELLESQIKEFSIRYVRIGKLVENGFDDRTIHPAYHNPNSGELLRTTVRDNLMQLLDFLNFHKIAAFFPTKALEYNQDMANLLKPHYLQYSIGKDPLERNWLGRGMGADWRLAQADAYLASGINTTITLAADVTRPPYPITDRPRARANQEHEEALKAIASAGKARLRVLPFRTNSGIVMFMFTGLFWEEAREHAPDTADFWKLNKRYYLIESGTRPKSRIADEALSELEKLCISHGLIGDIRDRIFRFQNLGLFGRVGNDSQARPLAIDAFWKDYFICGETTSEAFCNMCFYPEISGTIQLELPMSQVEAHKTNNLARRLPKNLIPEGETPLLFE